MILDSHPELDADIPPLPLLYRGFFHFTDSTSLASIQSGSFSSSRAFEKEVDILVKELCKIKDEKDKQAKTQGLLLEIRVDASFKDNLQSQRATGKHIMADHYSFPQWIWLSLN